MGPKHTYSIQVPLKIWACHIVPEWVGFTLSKSRMDAHFDDGLISEEARYGIYFSIKLGKRRVWSVAWYFQTTQRQLRMAKAH